MDSIRSDVYVYIDASRLSDVEYVKKAKTHLTSLGNSQKKIINIVNCYSLHDAVSSMYKFESEFRLSPRLFILALNIATNCPVNFDTIDGFDTITSFTTKKFIIQLIFIDRIRTFFREENDDYDLREFNAVSHTINLSKSLFQKATFRLDFLLSLLSNNIGGILSDKITDTKVELQKNFYGKTLLDYATEHGSLLCLQFLKLFNWDLSVRNLSGSTSLEVAIRSNQLQCLLVLIDSLDEKDYLRQNQRWLNMTDHRGFSLLLFAIENRKFNFVRFFLKCGLNVEDVVRIEDSYLDLANEEENFDILFELLKYDAHFPPSLKIQHEGVLSLIREREQFHDLIQNKDSETVNEFIQNFPQLRFGYNSKNVSAIRTAIQFKKFENFSLLRSQGFSKGIDNSFDTMFKDLSSEDKEEILRTNHKYFPHCTHDQHFIKKLIEKSKLGFNQGNNKFKRANAFEKIRSFYEYLSEIQEIQPIMKFVAFLSHSQIIFDFNHSHVQELDPLSSHCTDGITNRLSGDIYIGANNGIEDVCGVIAHEMTHLVMQEIYQNDGKPYTRANEIASTEFCYINSHYKRNSIMIPQDKIINVVYGIDYDESQEHCELIVRVPHLLAYYKNVSEERLLEVNRDYKLLFNFYQVNTLKDIMAEVEKIESKFIEMNDDVIHLFPSGISQYFRSNFPPSNLNDRTVIVTDTPVATLHQIYQTFILGDMKKPLIIAKLESFVSNKYRNQIKSQLKLDLNPTLIVLQSELENSRVDLISSFQTIVKGFKCKILLIIQKETKSKVVDSLDTKFHVCEVEHRWNELTESYQKTLLMTAVKFQQNQIELCKLLRHDDENLKHLPLKEFPTNEKLLVNCLKDSSISYFIPRKFELCAFDGTEIKSEKEIVQDLERTTIIADVPGMGKSVSLAHVAKELIQAFPTHWIVFVDLKLKIQSFGKAFEKLLENDFLTFFTQNIIKVKNAIDPLIFRSLYEKGKVILLLDGIDEINFHKEFVLKMILKYKTVETNRLIITTRIHLLRELIHLNTSHSYLKLVQFSDEDRVEFMIKYWNNKFPSISDDSLRTCALNIQEKFKNPYKRDSMSSFIGVPLQARMMVEICEDLINERVESFDEVFSKEIGISDFYEMFVKKMMDEFMASNGYDLTGPKTGNVDPIKFIMSVLYSTAVEFHFGSEVCEKLGLTLKNSVAKDKLACLKVFMLTENGSLSFIHASFGDFFLVQYFKMMIFGKRLNRQNLLTCFVELFLDVLIAEKYEVTRTFLNNAICESNVTNIPQVFSDTLFASMAERNYSVLHKPLVANQVNIILLLLHIIVNSGTSQISSSRLMKAFQEKNTEGATSLHIFCRKTIYTETMDKIIFAISTLSKDNVKTLLQMEESNGRNLLHESLHRLNNNVWDRFFGLVRDLFVSQSQEVKNIFLNVDHSGNSIFHSAFNLISISEMVQTVYENMETYLTKPEIENMLTSRNREGHNAFLSACCNLNIRVIEFVTAKLDSVFPKNEFHDILFSSDNEKNNAFHLLHNLKDSKSRDIYNFLQKVQNENPERFKQVLVEKNSSGATPLNIVLNQGRNKEAFEAIWKILGESFNSDEQLKEHFLLKANYGGNIFLCFHSSQTLDAWKSLLELVENTLTVPERKDLFQSVDLKNENVLHKLAIHRADSEIVEYLLTKAEQILDNKEFRQFLKCTCFDNNNPLHAFASCGDVPAPTMVYWTKLEETFSIDERKSFLAQKGFVGRNVLARSIQNCYTVMSITIWKLVENVFKDDRKGLQELLLDEEKDGDNIFCAAIFYQREFVIELLNHAKKCLSDEDFLSLFHNKVILQKAVKSLNPRLLEILLNTVSLLLRKDDLKKIIYFYIVTEDRDNRVSRGEDLLRYSLRNPNSGVYEIVRIFLQKKLTFIEYQSRFKETENEIMFSEPSLVEQLIAIKGTQEEKVFMIKNIVASFGSQSELVSNASNEYFEGRNVLYELVQNGRDPSVVKLFWSELQKKVLDENLRQSLKELLMVRCSETGNNLISVAATNNSCNMVLPVLQIIECSFEKNIVKDLLTNLNNSCQTNLHVLARFSYKSEDLSPFQDLFERLSLFLNTDNELKTFLRLVDCDGNTFLHSLAVDFKKFQGILDELVDKLFEVDELHGIWSSTNNENRNILNCLAMNQALMLRFTWPHVVSLFKKESVIHLTLHRDNDGINAINSLLSNNDDSIKTILQWLEQNCDRPLIEREFGEENGTSSMFNLAEKCAVNIINIYFDFLQRNVSNIIAKMMAAKSSEGKNILMIASINSNANSFEVLWNYFLKFVGKQKILEMMHEKHGEEISIHCQLTQLHSLNYKSYKKCCTETFGDETFSSQAMPKKRNLPIEELGECSKRMK